MAARTVKDFVVDFDKEIKSGGGGGIRVKPGTYHVRVVKYAVTVSKDKETPGLTLTLKFLSGSKKGKTFTETLYYTAKAYSRYRTLLEAVGKRIPKKISLERIGEAVLDEELYVEMVDEKPREGYSIRSRVAFEGFLSEADVDEDDDDEDDVEDDEDDDIEEDDADDDEEDADDEEDDDEEEEPEPPKRKRRSAAKPAAKKRRRPPADEDDDDLDMDDL